MISLEEIERTILELEQRDTTYSVCERLAWLYIVKDHLSGNTQSISAKVQEIDDSDFLKAAYSKDADKVLKIIDQHMECVRTIYPAEYDALVGMIKNL